MKAYCVCFLFLLYFGECMDAQMDSVAMWQHRSCTEVGDWPTSETWNSLSVALRSEVVTDSCNRVVRQWGRVDWLSGTFTDFTSVSSLTDTLPPLISDTILVADIPTSLQLHVSELSGMLTGHEYAFSPLLADRDTLILSYGLSGGVYYAFDLTTGSISHRIVTENADPECLLLQSDIRDTVVVTFDRQSTVAVTSEDIISGTTCSYRLSINGSSSGKYNLSANQIGDHVPVDVTIVNKWGSQTKTVILQVVGDPPQPLYLYIEDVAVQTGQLATMAVWSDDVQDLAAFQTGFCLDGVSEVRVIEDEMTAPDLSYSVLGGVQQLNLLWTSVTTQDFLTADNWFVIEVMPTINGSSADIISFGPCGAISNEAVAVRPAGAAFIEYDLMPIFAFSRRIISDSDDLATQEDLIGYPNPAADLLRIDGLSDGTAYEIYDAMGRLHARGTTAHNLVYLSQLAIGTYILKLPESNRSMRIVVAR